MNDPRALVVEKRLEKVRRVVAVCSAKGGVGKTMCAVVSSLVLAADGKRVGLLDLDLQGASAHIVLGVHPTLPPEDKGILPLDAGHGVALMSVAAFTGDRPLPLRGQEVTDALLELFAITQWGERDLLFIDMPPGIGDEVLDLIRLVPRAEVLVASTGSAISVAVVDRLLAMLSETVPVLGVLANAISGDSDSVRRMAGSHGMRFLGTLPFDKDLESCIGSPPLLLGSRFAEALRRVLVDCGLA